LLFVIGLKHNKAQQRLLMGLDLVFALHTFAKRSNANKQAKHHPSKYERIGM